MPQLTTTTTELLSPTRVGESSSDTDDDSDDDDDDLPEGFDSSADEYNFDGDKGAGGSQVAPRRTAEHAGRRAR